MSFSAQTKNSLARNPLGEKCCLVAEAMAMIDIAGNIQYSQQRFSLNVNCQSAAIARRIYKLLKSAFNLEMEILFRKKSRLKKNNLYLVRISGKEKVSEILRIVGKLDSSGQLRQGINLEHLKKKCCRRAYLRGVFLLGGTISNPEKSYHLEIYADYKEQAQGILQILALFKIKSRVIPRKKGYGVYVKEADSIVEFLKLIGAHSSLLSIENTRIIKDMRNNVNRIVNFETANVNKTVNASVELLDDIKIIQRKIGIENLPETLKDVAKLRIAYPEASLKEIGEMLEPPISKSGVNHRFRKLKSLARGGAIS